MGINPVGRALTVAILILGGATLVVAAPDAAAAGAEPGSYVAVTPTRLVTSQSLPGHATTTVQVTGHAGVPVGAAAVVATITAVGGATGGDLVAWKAGAARPGTTNVTIEPKETVSSQAHVALSSAGALSLYNGASAAAKITLDVVGYVRKGTATAAGTFTATTNKRLVSAKKLPANGTTTVQVGGQAGVAADAGAAVLTITAAPGAAAGAVSAYPAGSAAPPTVTLSFAAHRPISSQAVVVLNGAGAITLSNSSSAPVQVTVDSVGYLHGGSPTATGAMRAAARKRLVSGKSVAAHATTSVAVRGKAGIPSGASDAVLTLTASGGGPLTAYSADAARPGVISASVPASGRSSVEVTVALGSAGAITVYNGGATSSTVSVDAVAYVVAPDNIAPAPVSALTAKPTTSSVALRWQVPSDFDYTGVTIRRAIGATPPATPSAGTAVTDTTPSATKYTDTNLAGTTTYSYALFAHDGSGNFAAPADATVTTLTPLAVTTSTIPDGVVGSNYHAALTAEGGSKPYSWQLWSGDPDGLSVDADGVLTGQPFGAGTFKFTVQVSDDLQRTATKKFTLLVHGLTITTPATLPTASRAVPYSQQLTTQYGAAPVTFAVTDGALPDGLSLSESGAITGTPTTLGTATFTVTATDANFQSKGKAFSLTVAESPTPVVLTARLPDAELSIPYGAYLTAVGGTGARTWSISSGALPAGITLSAKGVLAGTPSSLGTSTVTITVTDAASHTSSKSFTVGVTAASDWTQPGRDAGRTGAAPDEGTFTAADVADQHDPFWSTTAAVATPAVAGGIAYTTVDASGESSLVAYDIATGSVSWQVVLPCTGGDVSVTSTLVLFPCNGKLRAYNRTGGHALAWSVDAIEPNASVSDYVVLSDRVIASDSYATYAYNLSTGARLWRQLVPSGGTASGGNGLAANSSVVLVPLSDRLRAYDVSNGSIKWTITAFATSVVVDGADAYAVIGQELEKLTAETGAVTWATTTGQLVNAVLGTDAARIYVELETPTEDCPLSELGAFTKTTGNESWHTAVPYRPAHVSAAGGLVWLTWTSFSPNCGGSGGVSVFRPGSGSQLGTFETGTPLLGSTVVANGRVFAPHADGLRVFGFDAPRPAVTSRVVHSGRVGTAYSQSLAASGGIAPYTWAITSGTLPAGLTLSAAGLLSGTPTAAATNVVTMQVTDARGVTASRPLTVQMSTNAVTQWPTVAGTPARIGFAPGESAFGWDNYAQLSNTWSSADGGYTAGDIAVSDTRAFVARNDDTGGIVSAYSVTSGASTDRPAVWTARPDLDNGTAPQLESGVTLSGTHVLVLAGDGLYSFNASTGAKQWRAPLETSQGGVGAPLVIGSTVYVGGSDASGRVAAFDLATGAAAWPASFHTDNWDGLGNDVSGPLASDGARVYATSACTVYALNPASGALVWKRVLTLSGSTADCTAEPTDSMPLVANGVLYVGSWGATMALDAATGAIVWARSVQSSGGFALSDGVLVFSALGFSSFDGSAYNEPRAVDAATGETIWTTTATTVPFPSRFAIVNDLVLAQSASGTVTGLDLTTGDILWTSDAVFGSSVTYAPAVAGGAIYFAAGDGRIYAYANP